MDHDAPEADAARTALILMDFQPAVLAMNTLTDSDTAALTANAQTALTWARSAGSAIAASGGRTVSRALMSTCRPSRCGSS